MITNSEENKFKRSEEVEHIVSRMPNKYGVQITVIVFVIILLLLILGFTISYPDILSGRVSINTESPAVKIVSNSSGKILLLKKNNEYVTKDDFVALIETSANFENFVLVDSIIKSIDINDRHSLNRLDFLPKRVHLGSMNNKYYQFLEAVQQFKNYYSNSLYDMQISTYEQLMKEQDILLEISRKKNNINSNRLNLTNEFARRDSILFEKRVISKSELEKNKIAYLNSEQAVIGGKSDISHISSEILKTQNLKNELQIKKNETEEFLLLKVTSTYYELMVTIKQYEDLYFFKSPQNGYLQYLSFLNNNIFIKAGEAVFSVVPQNNKVLAQVTLPNMGAGKVEVGQEVIIKLDNYPYNEFGSIRGLVNKISLVTNTEQTTQGNIESYLIEVNLPMGLKTNFGVVLDFKFELKGVAEIITKDRKLINRIFDNVNYMLSKKK